MHALRSDDQEAGADPGSSGWHSIYDNFQYVKDDWSTDEYWARHYVLIGLANTALHTIDSMKLSGPSDLINEAEAKWFRAFSYFELVRTYGEVPKIDFQVTDPAQAQIAKSSVSDIFALIDADLQFAEQHLPLTWGNKYQGRLTSGAAKTLHAETYLYRNPDNTGKANANWSAALALSQEVVNSGQYSLTPEYWKIWKTEGENNQESVFEIQAYQGPGGTDNYWSWWGTQQGVRGSGEWNLGWGWNTPTQNLVDSYEPGDKRKAATILFTGQSDNFNGQTNDPNSGGYGRTLPTGLATKYFNKKTYANPAEQAAVGDPNGAAYINQRVYRYADVLLMAAEAANELGGAANQTLATNYVNQIRERAGLSDVTFTTQAAMRDIIKKERRAEFGMEGKRFFDLVRWGDAEAVLAPLGYTRKNRYYPIPSPAINSNPKLIQNPEYP
jgi:hypothetical protein